MPFKLGMLQGYLVNHPDIVQQGLESEEWPPLARGRMDYIKYWYEGGLATKTGPVHDQHRDRMWIPNLADPAILDARDRGSGALAGPVDATAARSRPTRTCGAWPTASAGAPSPNESLHDKRPVVYEALAAGDAWLGRLVHPLGTLRWRLPTPESRRGHRLRRELDAAIDTLAAERRNGFEGDDLLRDWVRSNDELGATDADLRGSLKAFFGAENLHTHLAWTFYLLAQNPDVEAKLHEELDTGARRPAADAGRSRGPRVHPPRRHRVPAHLPVGPRLLPRDPRRRAAARGRHSSRPGACWGSRRGRSSATRAGGRTRCASIRTAGAPAASGRRASPTSRSRPGRIAARAPPSR